MATSSVDFREEIRSRSRYNIQFVCVCAGSRVREGEDWFGGSRPAED